MPESNSLYVGNLPLSFNDKSFRKLFSHFGEIESMKLLQRENVRGGQNKYGFVTFEDAENANEAMKQLNKKTVNEHELRANFARSSNDLVIKTNKKTSKKPFKKIKKSGILNLSHPQKHFHSMTIKSEEKYHQKRRMFRLKMSTKNLKKKFHLLELFT